MGGCLGNHSCPSRSDPHHSSYYRNCCRWSRHISILSDCCMYVSRWSVSRDTCWCLDCSGRRMLCWTRKGCRDSMNLSLPLVNAGLFAFRSAAAAVAYGGAARPPSRPPIPYLKRISGRTDACARGARALSLSQLCVMLHQPRPLSHTSSCLSGPNSMS